MLGAPVARGRRRAPRPALAAIAGLIALVTVSSSSLTRAQGAGDGCGEPLYDLGLERTRDGDREGALAAFRESLECLPSPNTRLLIARLLAELGRRGEAHEEYGRVIALARELRREEARFARTHEVAVTERAELEARLAWLRVEAHPAVDAAEIRVGDRVLPGDALGAWLAVDPGAATIRVAARGFEPAEQDVELEIGERRALPIRLVATASPAIAAPRPEPPAARDGDGGVIFGGVALGVGAAAAIAGGILLGSAHAIAADLEASCAGPCPSERAGDIELGRGLEAAGWGALLGGGVVAAVGLVVLLLQ